MGIIFFGLWNVSIVLWFPSYKGECFRLKFCLAAHELSKQKLEGKGSGVPSLLNFSQCRNCLTFLCTITALKKIINGATIWKALTRKCQRWKARQRTWLGRGLGVTFLLLLSLAQIILLSALIVLWVFAILIHVWCSKAWCRKAPREGKVRVLARGTRTREEQLAVFEPCPSWCGTITVLPCRFICVL